jgi:predicted nucleotidyltransferase
MRLDPKIRAYFRSVFSEKIPGSTVYLFGSRTDDTAKGGDIDLLVLTSEKIDKKVIRTIRVDFFQKFGWQKLDIANFTFDDQNTFRQVIQKNAIKL